MRTRSDTAVLACFDDNYAPAAAVAFSSLFLNNGHLDFDLYVIADDLDASNRDALTALCEADGRSLKFLGIETADYEKFVAPAHISIATYYRLFGPDKIEAEKILYLDVDIVVQADIKPLLDLELGDSLIAASPDRKLPPAYRSFLGISAEEPYLNTGVLVLNAAHWRAESVFDKLTAAFAANPDGFPWADQDLLNIVLAGRKTVMDRKWNFLYGNAIIGESDIADFDPATFDGILHYNTAEKPWHWWSQQPLRSLYQSYAARAPMRMPEPALPRNRDQLRWQMKAVKRLLAG